MKKASTPSSCSATSAKTATAPRSTRSLTLRPAAGRAAARRARKPRRAPARVHGRVRASHRLGAPAVARAGRRACGRRRPRDALAPSRCGGRRDHRPGRAAQPLSAPVAGAAVRGARPAVLRPSGRRRGSRRSARTSRSATRPTSSSCGAWHTRSQRAGHVGPCSRPTTRPGRTRTAPGARRGRASDLARRS
jgi:hypothetical protein